MKASKVVPAQNWLLLAWPAFLAAATFFVIVVPLGEGFDELPHFAYIQYIAQSGSLPLGQAAYPPKEVESFFQHHPVGWSLHSINPALKSHDEYWKQSPQVRELAERFLGDLRFSGRYAGPTGDLRLQDESHQPPLYYLLAAPIFAVASRHLSFLETFLIVRFWSVLMASLVIPGSFLLGRTIFKQAALYESGLALIVLFPGLYPAVTRVSNDALAVPLASWLFFLLIAFLKTERSLYLYGLAALILAGLWTKAFFIPMLIAVVVALFAYGKARAAGTVLLVSALGSPWYILNFLHSGSISGLPETILARTSVTSSLGVLAKLDWGNLFMVARSSHIWIGNSSLLGVRTWMYQVICWSFLFGIAGLLWRPRRITDLTLIPLILSYLLFVAALLYYATQVFQQTGMSLIQGWYLTSAIPLEAVLFVAGIQAWTGNYWKWPAATLALFLFALLFYTALFVAMPYYSGITSHAPSGHLGVYHPSLHDFPLMSSRLLRFYPYVPLFFPWLLLGCVAVFGVHSIFRICIGQLTPR